MLKLYITFSEELFMSLINPVYLDINTKIQIQERFEETSEINLPEFFLPEKFQAICDKLKSIQDWEQEGPPNRYFLNPFLPVISSSENWPGRIIPSPFTIFTKKTVLLIFEINIRPS